LVNDLVFTSYTRLCLAIAEVSVSDAIWSTTTRSRSASLAAAVLMGAPVTLEPVLCPAWHAAAGDAERLRVVIDQIASLTDTSAIARHKRV